MSRGRRFRLCRSRPTPYDRGSGEEEERDIEELSSASGTPQYMAPEQTRGAWREYGPWTDLYAVGCIAWEFVCGAPPFAGGSAFEIMIQHDSEERPPLEPEFPVPEGEGWIHRLMAIEPEERFPRAADTLRALRELERPETPSDREPESTSARLRALNRLGWAELKSWNLEAAATS